VQNGGLLVITQLNCVCVCIFLYMNVVKSDKYDTKSLTFHTLFTKQQFPWKIFILEYINLSLSLPHPPKSMLCWILVKLHVALFQDTEDFPF
jgi:hypothetical protein